jgi:hypothetical protein
VRGPVRTAAIRRAQVWRPTNIPALNLAAGPQGHGAFPPGATITCDYVEKRTEGHSPKFFCAPPSGDELKVKFGRDNGEVYAEVAATRLLWALGFGADAMYSVKVVCRGCPARLGGTPMDGLDRRLFDPAAVERKMPGKEIVTKDKQGWAWQELDLVDEETSGGAPRAHRDALKLVAALLQHSDSKPAQQRLACLDDVFVADAPCVHPFMLINDLGQTFGRANTFNRDVIGSANFARWSATPVWRDKTGCVANLSGSLTGTLTYPRISEEGRQFLAGLLVQLSDAQIDDLFEAARVFLRPRAPDSKERVSASVDEWREAFKRKREEIVNRRCEN